jgi:hypothetical protein
MKKLILMLATLVSIPGLAQIQDYLGLHDENTDFISDLVLIYQGGVHRPDWSEDQFAPYVTFRDSSFGQEEWLFDGFLFIEFKDNRGFEFAHGYKQKPARKTEWEWLLDRVFEKGKALDALDRSIAKARIRIGAPSRMRRVVLTLPEPITNQDDWGELGGKILHFSRAHDRVSACVWYLEEALQRWKESAPSNLVLSGFYWVAEYGSESQEILPRISKIIREGGKKFYWIPYWKAANAGDWKSLGFDAVYQQPNHFFNASIPDTRLTDACVFAKLHNMGMEMEFDHRAINSPIDFRPRFYSYLHSFRSQGAANRSAIAYYEGGGAIMAMANSPDPGVRKMYFDLSRFILLRQSSINE